MDKMDINEFLYFWLLIQSWIIFQTPLQKKKNTGSYLNINSSKLLISDNVWEACKDLKNQTVRLVKGSINFFYLMLPETH
jgi:hypothetical protein